MATRVLFITRKTVRISYPHPPKRIKGCQNELSHPARNYLLIQTPVIKKQTNKKTQKGMHQSWTLNSQNREQMMTFLEIVFAVNKQNDLKNKRSETMYITCVLREPDKITVTSSSKRCPLFNMAAQWVAGGERISLSKQTFISSPRKWWFQLPTTWWWQFRKTSLQSRWLLA